MATITVKAIQTAVNVHDSTLYVGTTWKPEDNFDSAIDKDGNPVDFQDLIVEGSVDTTKAGTYEVKYSYDGVTSVATITVKYNEIDSATSKGDKGHTSQIISRETLPHTGDQTSNLWTVAGLFIFLLLLIYSMNKRKQTPK